MKRKILCLAIAALSASPLMALDEASVLQRLEQLEQQRQADQAEIEALKKQVRSLRSTSAPASLTSSEAQQLHEHIVKVDTKAKRRNASLKRKIEGDNERLKINGFMSVYAVRSTIDDVTLDTGIDRSWGFSSDTVAGLQFDYKVSDDIDAVLQLTAKGFEGYDVEAEWAFLRYKASDDITLRAGRLRLPFYMYSEVLDVGYAYPWVRPPIEIYASDVTTYSGLDASYGFDFAGWGNTIKIFYGGIDESVLEIDDFSGVEFTAENGPWTLRGVYANGDESYISIPTGLSTSYDTEGLIKYTALGARYDDGSWFGLVEVADIDASKGLPLVGVRAYTGTFGYQFDRFMPYFVYSKLYSNSSHEKNIANKPVFLGLEPAKQESYTAGLRYNATSQVTLKGEVAVYDGFDGSMGARGLGASDTPAAPNPSLRKKLDDDGVTIMSVGFDMVF